MYIQSTNNNYNISYYGKKPPKSSNSDFGKLTDKLKQIIVDIFPETTVNDSKDTLTREKKIDELLSRPDVNRLVMGATAIVTQPPIDYFNHRVDDDTRTVSRNRTIAKIVAGTTVGIIVRGSCYKLVEKMTDLKSRGRLSKALLPKDPAVFKELIKFEKFIKNYKNALSTGIAILAMCFTNFLIDAPLTVYFTNKLNEKTLRKKNETEVKHG